MKHKILVFPGSSEIGLEIHQALMNSIHVDLFGASSVSSNHGKYVYKNYIEGIPYVDKPEFIEKLNEIIDLYNIDFVIPAHDSVLLKLTENLEKLHCDLIGSPVETCKICRSKKKTYEILKNKIRVPQIFERGDDILKFPLFMKPDVGQGSKGVYLARTMEDVEFYLRKDQSLLMLEYLPGTEYTIDCFTDRYGKLRFSGARERIRIMNGISVNTKPVFDEKFTKLAEIINSVLVFRGVWFFQVKKSIENELTLMEIAPRIAGSMGLYRNLGINFALLSIFDALDLDIKIKINEYEIEMDRALINRFKITLDYKHVYIDLDDTIIVDNKINTFVISFLYQCLNNDIKIHLLSKHDGNINEILSKYRLESFFDTITHISKSDDKTNYIKEKSAIFIDDSFSERKTVSDKLGLPTFEISAIESLIDWRV